MGLPKKGASPETYYQAGVHLEAMLDLDDTTSDLVPYIVTPNQKLDDLMLQKKKLSVSLTKAY